MYGQLDEPSGFGGRSIIPVRQNDWAGIWS
jgi:hypothetical protein